MPHKYFQKICLIVALLAGIASWSQSGMPAINFIENKVSTDESGVITAYVKIINNTPKAIEGTFDVHSSHEDLYLVQRKPRSITLQVNDSIFIPVKAIISTTALAGNKTTIEAAFTPTGSSETQSAFLPVIISEKKLVKMFLTETNLIYEKVGDSLNIPVRLSNEGNTPQKITLIARYPGFIVKNSIESEVLTIAPFTDTIVNIRKQVTKTILNEEDFSITINALYANGDIIASGFVRASSLKQDRRYTVPFQQTADVLFQHPNQVTASYQRNNNQTDIYYLLANAEVKMKDASLKSNLDLTWWDKSEVLYLRNTWLAYDHKVFGVQAGNINRFADINLVGRGAQGYYKIDEKNTIETGAIDKAYNLVDDLNASLGNAAWATFEHDGGSTNKGYEVNAIYDQDEFYKTSNYLASTRHKLFRTENFDLIAGAGISNAASETNNESKTGGAGELIANGKFRNFYYSSSNYMSTGYYSGLRKGVFSLNERVNLALGKYNLWGAYTQLTADPKFFENQYATTQFSNSRYDLGLSRRFKSFSVSVAPYYYTEKRNELLYGATDLTEYTLKAARGSVGFMYFDYISRQNATLTLEGGLFNSGQFENEFHYKANFNYTWKMLNLLVFYQYNYFYLGEVISSQYLNTDETYYNLTISPTVQYGFFNNKLLIYAGVLYSKSSVMEDMRQVNGRADYNISKDFSVFATGFYSDFADGSQQTNSILVGVTKRFNPVRIDRTKNDLEVYVYYDSNGKGPLDGENLPATDQLVIIDGKAFKTNSRGIIKYRALPEGNYEIRPVTTNEWHARAITTPVNQDTKVAIGLNKTCTIKGSIIYHATEKSYQITRKMAGLSIIGVDDNGNVFHTKTDENGNFTLYVPKGNYTITLEKNGVSEYVEIDNNNQAVTAEPSEIKEVGFSLTIKEKRVETKKFTSRGFPAMSDGDDKKKKK